MGDYTKLIHTIGISCGALPETLIDSELFGHERGAFTSAVSHRLGRVELAEGGTLFLDEIGDMAVETQVKLLRLLEEGTFERVGSSETLTAKTRIVAATNRNLEEMVSTGDFREDLYYRLNAFPMYLPPLRERKEDIPYLAEFFKHRMATHLNKQIGPFDDRSHRSAASLPLAWECARIRAYDKPRHNRVSGFSN